MSMNQFDIDALGAEIARRANQPQAGAGAGEPKTWRELFAMVYPNESADTAPPSVVAHFLALENANLRAQLARQRQGIEYVGQIEESSGEHDTSVALIRSLPVGTKLYTTPAAAQAAPVTTAEIHTLRRLIECAETLDKRPRPMCRDCADEDGTCPNSGLDCDMRKLFASAKALHNKLAGQAAQGGAVRDAGQFLLPDDLAALKRFYDCCEDTDSGGHDVSKERMRRLAEIGVVQSMGFGRHQITAFGDYVLGSQSLSSGYFALPLKTFAEYNADAALRATHPEGKE